MPELSYILDRCLIDDGSDADADGGIVVVGVVTSQVISDSVCQGKRNCLLVICFICIFIFAVLRLQEGLV